MAFETDNQSNRSTTIPEAEKELRGNASKFGAAELGPDAVLCGVWNELPSSAFQWQKERFWRRQCLLRQTHRLCFEAFQSKDFKPLLTAHRGELVLKTASWLYSVFRGKTQTVFCFKLTTYLFFSIWFSSQKNSNKFRSKCWRFSLWHTKWPLKDGIARILPDFTDELQPILKPFKERKAEGLPQGHPVQQAILYYTSQGKTRRTKWHLVNTDANISNKILAHIKKNINHDPIGFILEMQGWLEMHKPINIINPINELKDKITWSSKNG